MRNLACRTPRVAPPSRAPSRRAHSAVLAVTAAAVVISGCASNTHHRQPYGVTQHAAVPAPIPRAKVEIEDDGKPVQSPPARAVRPEDDDPTQPWSPNYGRTAQPSPQPVQPVAVRATYDNAPTGRPMTHDEIVARAIAQQEMASQQRR